MAQEFAVNECESRCLAVSHGTVAEGVTVEEVVVSEAVVGVEGEGRVPAAVTAVLGRDPAAVTAGMVTNTIITLLNSLLSIIKKAFKLLAWNGNNTGSFTERYP